MQFLYLYLISIPLFVILDFIWIGLIARDFYWSNLGHLLGEIKWIPLILFYAVFLFGLTYFVTHPLLGASFVKIFLSGALFGLVTYATYDLVNHGLLKDWPSTVTIVDMFWGTVLSSVISVATIWIYRLAL